MYYERPTRINYYDCDRGNLLKVSAAMRHMQQCSSEHLEVLGHPTGGLREENMVFLLTKTCLKVHKMPVCTQEVVVGTVATRTRGVRWVREFVVNSLEGERLLSAYTLWILADPDTHKVLRPSKYPYNLPFMDSILEGAIGDAEIPRPPEGAEGTFLSIPIRYSHLDVNNHVNNSMYGDFVCDALPYDLLVEKGLDTVVISYQKEARWGESLEISTTPVGDGEYYIGGLHGGSPCFEAYAKLCP